MCGENANSSSDNSRQVDLGYERIAAILRKRSVHRSVMRHAFQ